MKSSVESLARLGVAEAQAVKAVAAKTVHAVTNAGRTGWLPVEYDVALGRAVSEVCGEDPYLQWCRDAIFTTVDAPLLQPFIGALRRVGLGPRRAVRRMPSTWNLFYRDCGLLYIVDESDTHATLEVRHAAKALHGLYAVGTAAAIGAVVTSVGGRHVQTGARSIGRHLRLRLHWAS